MRIVLLVPKMHVGAELAMNKLLRRKDLHIIGIIRSDISPLRKKYWRYMVYGVRRAGLFYGLLIAATVYLPLAALAMGSFFIWRRRRWLRINELVVRHHLKLHDTENINREASLNILKSWKPDILVSLYFNQILKKPALEIPSVAALNMHPGLLPKYRGLWPEFWKLHNREKQAGVTIHRLNEDIDAGEILAQMRFPIKKHDTKFSLALKSARHGSRLLIQTLQKIKIGLPLKPLKIKGLPTYYTFPEKQHFNRFFRQGKKLFSFLGIWKEYERNC